MTEHSSPNRLLLVTPLLSTSFSLFFANDQNFFLSIFNSPSLSQHRHRISALLPHYFARFFYTGAPIAIGLNAVTVCSVVFGLRALRSAVGGLETAKNYYVAGLALTIAHFLFVPAVAGPVQDIVEDRSRGESERDLDRWLWWHRVRMISVDLPGWACFLGGFLALPTGTL